MERRVAGSEMVIGTAGPCSGRAAVLGKEMTQAVALAVAERNAAGGILGATIRAMVADDAGEPVRGEAIARDFAAHAAMLGVVGHYNSDVTLAVSPIYHAAGLTLITPIVSNPALTAHGYTNVFRFTNRDDATGNAIAAYLYRRREKRRAVVVAAMTRYGTSMAEQFAQAFLLCGGAIVTHQTVREGASDFMPLVSALPADFDVLFYGGTFEGAGIVRALRALGHAQLFAAGDGCWDITNFVQPAGEAATLGEGVLVLSATPEIGRVAGSREFAQRYAQHYGPIGNYAVNAYDTTRLLLDAIQQAAEQNGGVPNRAAVMASVRAVQFHGIAYHEPVTWDTYGENTAATTALHVVVGDHFEQVAEIQRMDKTAG